MLIIRNVEAILFTEFASETADILPCPLISNLLIVSKSAHASECDIVLVWYHMLRVFVV